MHVIYNYNNISNRKNWWNNTNKLSYHSVCNWQRFSEFIFITKQRKTKRIYSHRTSLGRPTKIWFILVLQEHINWLNILQHTLQYNTILWLIYNIHNKVKHSIKYLYYIMCLLKYYLIYLIKYHLGFYFFYYKKINFMKYIMIPWSNIITSLIHYFLQYNMMEYHLVYYLKQYNKLHWMDIPIGMNVINIHRNEMLNCFDKKLKIQM